MRPAPWPREEPLDERLLVIDPAADRYADARVRDLPGYLREGDLLVVNDAATLPASLQGHTDGGEPVEVRLLGSADERTWDAILFGAGDWRTRTEDRPLPPALAPGDRVRFGDALSAWIADVVRGGVAGRPRLVAIRFDREGAPFWSALYRVGRPVQYAHTAAPLELWHTQTRYPGRPWAVEMPSAGRPLTWGQLLELRRRGVGLARVTHAAGLSSSGDPQVDALLPLPERYDIPARTVAAIHEARRNGGRVVAVGTTVVRALEGAVAERGELLPGAGITDLSLGPGHRLRVVDALLTGMHDPTTSHYRLLQAFAPAQLLDRAHRHASSAGYLEHEFGDGCLIAAGALDADHLTSFRTHHHTAA